MMVVVWEGKNVFEKDFKNESPYWQWEMKVRGVRRVSSGPNNKRIVIP